MENEQEELELLRLRKKKSMAAPKEERRSPMQMMKAGEPQQGAAEAILNIGTGMAAGPIAGYAGLAGAALPGPKGQGADWARRTQEALTYQPRNEETKKVLDFLGTPFAKMAEWADKGGGKVTDVAGPVAGTVTNVALNALPMMLNKGIDAGAVLARNAAKIPLRDLSKWTMAKAVSPTPTQWKTGEAAKAIDTMLEKGYSPTKSGVEQMRSKVDDLNTQISNVLKDSTAMVDKNAVLVPLMQRLEKFKENVTPNANMNTLKKAWKEFTDHPYFKEVSREGDRLAAAAKGRAASKASALQEAGKFQTFAAQQENLAHGGGIKLAKEQPVNEPYMNVGTGDKTLSPSAYPVAGQPRVPGRYTENIQRVPEGKSAEADARGIYEKRKLEEQVALSDLAKFPGKDMIPIQKAQAMKVGTYRELESAYAKLNMPDASKQVRMDLAKGLKEQIAKEAPEVNIMNQEESALLNALSVAEHKMYKDMSKQIGGMAWNTSSLGKFIAFMGDRSTAYKALIAKKLYSESQVPKKPLPTTLDFAKSGAIGLSLSEIGTQNERPATR